MAFGVRAAMSSKPLHLLCLSERPSGRLRALSPDDSRKWEIGVAHHLAEL